jgi:hypothetical protein
MGPRKIHSRLTEIIHNTQGVLLDFDGPICSVFAGVSAPSVAARLRNFALDQGVSLPLDLIEENDPLHVLRRIHDLAPHLTEQVESTLRAAEIEAAASASPTPHAQQALIACRQTTRRVAIVTNNSADAVQLYLTMHHLAENVEKVIGRARCYVLCIHRAGLPRGGLFADHVPIVRPCDLLPTLRLIPKALDYGQITQVAARIRASFLV